MNNLKLLKQTEQKFDFITQCKSFSIDDVTGNLAFADDSTVFAITESGSVTNHKFESSESDKIKFIHVISSPLVCITTDKSMTIWNSMDGTNEDYIELEESIQSVEWSPDFSVGVVITNDMKITLITSALEQLAESNLQQEGFGAAEFVTVGWGKKETQFHGSLGKQAAHQSKDAVTPLSVWDNNSTLVTWRHDGDYFAVSWVVRDSIPHRQVRVFSAEAILHSTAEHVSGLEQGLCWNPKRNVLVASQRHPTGLNIIFYETNGLRHGEFQLFPSKIKSDKKTCPAVILSDHIKVDDLAFNRDGDILAVSFVGIQGNECLSFVRLYTTCNYHWYVKQELIVKQPLFKWCPIDAGRLHLLHSGGVYVSSWWCSVTHRSEIVRSDRDPALVAVIDNNSVHFTSFRHMVIPPPMSAYSVIFSRPVNFLCLPGAYLNKEESHWTSACLVVLSDRSVYLINFVSDSSDCDSPDDVTVSIGAACGGGDFKVMCRPPSSIQKVDICLEGCLNHGVWLSPHLICLTSGGSIFLLEHNLKDSSWNLRKCYELTSSIVSICNGFDNQRLFVEIESGDVLACSIDSMVSSSGCVKLNTSVDCQLSPCLTSGHTPDLLAPLFPFPQICTQIYSVCIDEEELIIGLCTSSHQLYAGTKPIMSLCSSMALHRNFLIVTSMLQTISSVPLDIKLLEFYQCFDDQADKNTSGAYENKIRYDEKIRAIEPGAVVVSVVPVDTKVVLQMPRGNLETIHPRALVLSYLRLLIDGCQYCKAVDLMKRHRINFNLLYDHNPDAFLANIDKFVTDVDNAAILNIFLVDIIPEDLTQTMYSKFYRKSLIGSRVDELENSVAKPDRITDAMIKCLDKLDQKKYLFTILTCYAKKTKPQLDEALIRMRKYKESGDMSTWDACLQHLKYLCDIVKLYHIALATYDLELAASIAECTQLDPKEYIPFLNELRILPEYIKRYRIDLLLKNYRDALTNIVRAGLEYFDDCLQLVKNHKLYSAALDLYAKDSAQYKALSECFAEYLIKEEKSLSAAGSVYLRCGLFKQAADCFYRANNCGQWLITATHLERETREEQSKQLAVRLIDLNRYSEAVTIYEEHLQDHEEAVRTAAKGALWETAVRLCNLHALTSLIDTTVLADLNRCCDDFVDRLANHKSEFLNLRQRLLVVRQKHKQDFMDKQYRNDPDDPDDRSEIFSDTSSVSGSSAVSTSSRFSARSNLSKASGRSSKTKRKAKRKKWTLKEGSALEEVALMESLHKNVTVAQSFVDECRSLIDNQIAIGSCSVSRNLSEQLNSLLRIQSDSLSIIWDGQTWPIRLTNTLTAHLNVTSLNMAVGNTNSDNVSNTGRKIYDIQEEFLYFPPKMAIRSIKNPIL